MADLTSPDDKRNMISASLFLDIQDAAGRYFNVVYQGNLDSKGVVNALEELKGMCERRIKIAEKF